MTRALQPGRATRRRPVFGLFDPEGWAWATAKASFWLLVIIVSLGYIPDRAYYFVVSRTIELGLLGWSPINLCPPENGTGMPCPVPAGGIVPWKASSPAALPQARTDGVAAQLGKNLLYIGGSDGQKATATTYVAPIDGTKVGAWGDGPALPDARSDAGIAILSGTAYLVGGVGPDGQPTDTVWSIGLNPDTSALGTWTPVKDPSDKAIALPSPRAGAAALAVTDGILVIGGAGTDGRPTTTVWKSTIDTKTGKLTAFKEQPSLLNPVTDADAALEGTFVWVYGGTSGDGPTNRVQRASYGTGAAVAGASPAATGGAAASPAASAAPEGIIQWATTDSPALNLPGPRAGGSGWTANGGLYLAGGTDGSSAKRELWWALPDASGNLAGGWRHLDLTDLPAGVSDAAAVVSGSTVMLIGGTGSSGTVATSTSASLAPQEPFFRAGLVGVVVPALQIGGEIGQQLGYLAAAGVGTGNFVILVIIAWAFNHRQQLADWRERRRAAREAKAPAG
jgi:hypothetical protein